MSNVDRLLSLTPRYTMKTSVSALGTPLVAQSVAPLAARKAKIMFRPVMLNSAKVLISAGLVALTLAAQTPPEVPPAAASKASAYYNYSMGHLYAELAGAYGNRADYVTKAIEYYRQALKQDPGVGFLFEELTDLYIQAGRLKDAVSDAEDMLKQDPKNIEARRILGRIYQRLIGDGQQGKINEEMLRRSIEQYAQIAQADPKDLEALLTLGRLYRVGGNSVDAEKSYNAALKLEPNNDEALTGLAVVLADLGDSKRSAELLKIVASHKPEPRTLAALASQYEQMRDFKSAADVLKQALDLQPDNQRLKRALAQNLLFSERIDDSLKLYLEIAKEEPADAELQLRIAEIYRQKRDFTKARAALNAAKAIDKDSLEVRYDEVNMLEAEGKTTEALNTLKGIVEETAKKGYSQSEKVNRIRLLERLGTLYRTANQPQEAVDTYRKISELDPETAPRIAVVVVDTWRSAKNLAKAKEEADAAVKQYPSDRMVKVMHAGLLGDMGKTDAAVSEMKALLKGEKDKETWFAIAQVYEKAKRFDEMAKALDEAEKLGSGPQDQQTLAFMRGAMYERMKKFDLAEGEFKKVLEADPNSASALNYLGYMLADRAVRLDEAHKMISRALELDPGNGAYLDSLGWVLFRRNQLEEAENTLVRALEKIGTDPTVHDHLGDVYAKRGKVKEAIKQWQSSIKEWESGPQTDLDPAEVAKVAKKLESAKVRLAKESGSKQQ